MFTATVEHEGVAVVIGRATPLTLLMRSVYRRALIATYPDIERWMDDLDRIDGDTAGGEQDARTAYLETLSEDERRILNSMSSFIHYASFIVSAKGLPFAWPKVGEMPARERVQEMFGYYMSDMSGLWTKIMDAILELNQNLAPSEEQAIVPGTEDTVDPNVSRLTENGWQELDGMPVELFSGEPS